MALRLLDEVFLSAGQLPAFLFFGECLEMKRWRLLGADTAELGRRIAKVAKGLTEAEIDEGPGEEA